MPHQHPGGGGGGAGRCRGAPRGARRRPELPRGDGVHRSSAGRCRRGAGGAGGGGGGAGVRRRRVPGGRHPRPLRRRGWPRSGRGGGLCGVLDGRGGPAAHARPRPIASTWSGTCRASRISAPWTPASRCPGAPRPGWWFRPARWASRVDRPGCIRRRRPGAGASSGAPTYRSSMPVATRRASSGRATGFASRRRRATGRDRETGRDPGERSGAPDHGAGRRAMGLSAPRGARCGADGRDVASPCEPDRRQPRGSGHPRGDPGRPGDRVPRRGDLRGGRRPVRAVSRRAVGGGRRREAEPAGAAVSGSAAGRRERGPTWRCAAASTFRRGSGAEAPTWRAASGGSAGRSGPAIAWT